MDEAVPPTACAVGHLEGPKSLFVGLIEPFEDARTLALADAPRAETATGLCWPFCFWGVRNATRREFSGVVFLQLLVDVKVSIQWGSYYNNL